MDIEQVDTNMNDSRAALKQKFKLLKVQVVRKQDFGNADKAHWVNCHLGELLNYNDTVLGYDLEQINCTALEGLSHKKIPQLPEVIIVKKAGSKKHAGKKLTRLTIQEQIEEESKAKKKSRVDKAIERQQQTKEKDMELFLEDLEDEDDWLDLPEEE